MKIGIVGGGWYGCHIALSLASSGYNVRLFESCGRLLNRASGNNQFRLHMGFHYSRHQRTRLQSRDGFQRFVERYPSLTKEVPLNIYAVPARDSLIDFSTYRLIMAASGLTFAEWSEHESLLRDVQGAVLTEERVLLIAAARSFFAERLGDAVALETPVVDISQARDHISINGESFDFAIDATWGHLTPPLMPVFYEPTILLYYGASEESPAITFVDGPLSSVYPTELPGLFTLSSVRHTPLGVYRTPMEARAAVAGVDSDLVDAKKRLMEEAIGEYVINFHDQFKFEGVQLAIKTKPVGLHDDRSCYVEKSGRLISVLSGKIDTIFFAMDEVRILLESEFEGNVNSKRAAQKGAPGQTLRSDLSRTWHLIKGGAPG